MSQTEWEQLIDNLADMLQGLGAYQWASHHQILSLKSVIPIRQPRFGGRQGHDPALPAVDIEALRKNALEYAYHLTGCNNDKAQDLVQTALLRYWQTRESLRDANALYAYVRQIVHHLYMDEMRERHKEAYPLMYAEGYPAPDNPAESVLTMLELDACLDALYELSLRDPESARLIIQHNYEGVQLKDLAQQRGESAGTTRSKHRRVLQ